LTGFSWRVGTTNTFYAVMNKDKWNGLPADIKKIFDEVGREFKARQAMAWQNIKSPYH
jgi:TRAP-type transport system periplasmic protein